MKNFPRVSGASRWVATVAMMIALAPSAAFADTIAELTCVTKYFFWGHLRGSDERGNCTSDTSIDGPTVPIVSIDDKNGANNGKDELAQIDAEVTVERDEVFKTKVSQRPLTKSVATAASEGYLRRGVGNLLSIGYLGEVDKDPNGKCVNSRYLKVICTVREPKK